MESTKQLTSLQLELVKLFDFQTSKKQLLEIKGLLADYFAKNTTKKMDDFLLENNLDLDEFVEETKDQHLRSKYD